MSDDHQTAGQRQSGPKRGGRATPRHLLAGAMPFRARAFAAADGAGPPPNFIRVPAQISMWGNYDNGDCVTAEEAFAKACETPEIFIPDATVIAWATAHNGLNGAILHDILVDMQTDGFVDGGHTYDDGSILAVNWTDINTLNQAIWQGPVKLGVAADQLDATWHAAGGSQARGVDGWIATGYQPDTNEDHCVSLCGYGSLAWLAQQLNGAVPAGVDGTAPGFAVFTWDSIGVIDMPSMVAITQEAWLRSPTTVIH